MNFQNLYNTMVGCKKCNNGYVDDQRCECYFRYIHKVVCLYAGFNENMCELSLEQNLNKFIKFEHMITNNLGLVLVGSNQQAQIYVCYSIWKQLDLFTRVNSTLNKITINFSKSEVKNCDINAFCFRKTTDFHQKSFYEKMLNTGKAWIIIVDTDDKERIQETFDFLQLGSSFKAHSVLDIDIDVWKDYGKSA